VIIMFLSYLVPLGIPVQIRAPSREVYEFIKNLPVDSAPLLFSLDFTAGGAPEIRPSMVAVIKHCMSKGLKFVIVGIGTDESTALMQALFDEIEIEKEYEYGVDYVGIGYIPGGEITVAALAQDFQSVVETDAYGNKASDLPLTKNIKDYKDFSAVIPYDSAGVMMFWVRNWTPYDIPFYCSFTAGSEPTYVAFYNAGDIEGYMAGLRGGAEYELLAGFKSIGVKSMDLQSLTHLYAFILIVAGNIILYAFKGGGG
jgi:hypothetical protein